MPRAVRHYQAWQAACHTLSKTIFSREGCFAEASPNDRTVTESMNEADLSPKALTPDLRSDSGFQGTISNSQSVMLWTLIVISIGYLWLRLIDNLRIEWSSNPQYSYGWIVPLLCLGLLARRWKGDGGSRGRKSEIGDQSGESATQSSELKAQSVDHTTRRRDRAGDAEEEGGVMDDLEILGR